MKKYKFAIFIVAIFAMIYFTSAGSTIFNNYETNAVGGTSYISKITMQQVQDTVNEAVVKNYAVTLTKRFRFENGTVGYIPYFYGAKATQINELTGLDERFGTLAYGTSESGASFYKMYGLDCSGYISYVMYLSGIRGFPHGSSNQYAIGDSVPISQAETGDLLIYRDATTNLITHIGMVLVDEGKLYDIHCNASDNGVKGRLLAGIGTKADGYYWQEIVKNPYVTHE